MILIKADYPTDMLYQKILHLLAGNPEEISIIQVPKNKVESLSFSGLTINPFQKQVLWDGTEIHLTYLEFQTLFYLAKQPGRVFTKNQIYQHVYQGEPSGDVNNIIYCLIRSLRKKLEPDPRHPKYIHTVRGVGYKFEPLSEE